jgi:hypothetical protein
MNRRQPPPKRAVIIVFVLVVVALLALAGYSFAEFMFTEHHAARLTGRGLQARALAESGLEYVKITLTQTDDMLSEQGGIYSNPALFQGIQVVDGATAADRGRFSVVAPNWGDSAQQASSGIRFGLEDESTRLNVNALLWIEDQVNSLGDLSGAASALTGGGAPGGSGNAGGAGGGGGSQGSGGSSTGSSGASGATSSASASASSATSALTSANPARDLLMGLPGMTEPVADAILDWVDEDDVPREFGAEIDYYSGLSPPYAPKNGPLETVEELLLVRGVTPTLLFGADSNRNGLLDANEEQAASGLGVDNSDGSMNRGWSAYLTLYGMEGNRRSDGTPRIALTGDDLEALHTELLEVFTQDEASFIVALLQNGPYAGTEGLRSIGGMIPDFNQQARGGLTSVLDLLVPGTQISTGEGVQPVPVANPFGVDPFAWAASLPKIMENLTVNSSPTIPGRININQAPRAILQGIPGLEPTQVDQILSQRSPEATSQQPGRAYETWIVTEGIVTLDQMRTLMPFLCAGGDVYRVQIVGYYDEGGPPARIEAVVDAATSAATPTVLFWRDLSHLGRGYPLETLGIGAP